MSTTDPLATVDEVAAFLGVPVGTLYQWRHRRSGPPACRVGRHLRYRWPDVEGRVAEQVATDRQAAS